MNLRQTRQWLWWGSGLLALGAALALALGLLWPYRPAAVPTPATQPAGDLTDSRRRNPTLTDFQQVLDLELRAAAPAAPAAPPEPPPLRLIGTMIEPGFVQALFQTNDGRSELKAVGEKIDDVEVLEVREGEALVLYRGQKVLLKASAAATPPE